MSIAREDLAEMRREFASREPLLEEHAASEPFEQFSLWMREAVAADIIDPNAMTLATVGPDKRPSERVVLLKYFDANGFTFFTNYESKKGSDLASNPFAVIHFFWPQLDRQIAVYGRCEKTSREISEQYFNSRPAASRLGAWASSQSRPIASRDELEMRVAGLRAKYGDDVPLPPHWGGFTLVPDKFEFWQGRESRLHDRLVYELEGGKWAISRLSP